jgi:excisionase family DNA binding protein
MEKLYTMEQLAEVLHLNKQTVRRFCGAGKIKSIKIGRRYMVKESSLELYTSGLAEKI